MFKSKNSILKAPARYFNHKQKLNQCGDINKSKKVQNDIQIKPSSGYEKQIDYRFETEEQIETEEQCQKFQNKGNCQKRNNSFSSSGPDVQIPFGKKKERKQLEFYCCDSLAIRPSGNIRNQQKSKFIPNQSIYSSIGPKKSINEQTTQNEGGVQKQTKLLSLKPQVRQKRKIFDNIPRLNKIKQSQQLPLALLPTENVIREFKSKSRQQIQNQFHIIIETDEITQCCL